MSNDSLVEPSNRQIFDHIHTLNRASLQCELEGFKLILSHLHAIEQRLERIEAHINVNGTRT